MATTKIIAQRRKEIGKKHLKTVRSEGNIPAVIYGHGKETVPVKIDRDQFMALTRGEHHGYRG